LDFFHRLVSQEQTKFPSLLVWVSSTAPYPFTQLSPFCGFMISHPYHVAIWLVFYSIRCWKFSLYLYFLVLCHFVFLAIIIATFSNISHCPNPTQDIYNWVGPPYMFSPDDRNRTGFQNIVLFFLLCSWFVCLCVFSQVCLFCIGILAPLYVVVCE
jgi:hypothetical protein